MNLNILLRGQSNAIILGEQVNDAGVQAIVAEVQRLLGFDGVMNTVTLDFDFTDPAGNNTAAGGTGLLGEWLSPINGDWQQGWTVNFLEQGLLNYIDDDISAVRKADPTAVVWLHSEYDSARGSLTAAEWESAVRFDAALVRQAFGRNDIPYIFVDPVPYEPGTDAGTQAIRLGMQTLAADPTFGARIGAQASDLDMNDTFYGGSGGHMSSQDALTVAQRTARTLAELWAPYALEGSPVDLAGGNLDNIGPLAVQALQVGERQLTVGFTFDQADGFNMLDPDAAAGLGWSVRAGGTVVQATGVVVTGADSVLLTFGSDLPAGGRLYYNYGIGKLGGANGSGQGNALYDNQFMPAHAPATGLLIDAAPITPGQVLVGTGNADVLVAGANGDTLIGGAGADYMLSGAGADTYLLSIGDGSDWIENFAPGMDHLQFGMGILIGNITTQVLTIEGVNGLAVTYSSGGDFAFLAGVTTLQPGDLVFSAVPPPVAEVILGTAGPDQIGAGAGGDTIIGGKSDDYLVGGSGADVFGFSLGDGVDWIDRFQPGTDRLVFSGGLTMADIRFDTYTIENVPGLAVLYGSGNDAVFLARVTELLPGDIAFDLAPGGVEVLAGTPGADTLYGGSGDTTFMVNHPGDVVVEAAGGGTDTVIASVGFYLSPNVENLVLAAGAGSIFGVGNARANVITGNEAGNLLIGGEGNDSIAGGEGNDTLRGTSGDNMLSGEGGDDVLVGVAGADTMFGGAGQDWIVGGGGADSLDGGAGDDTIRGGNLASTLSGGDGNDLITGGTGADTINGGNGNNRLNGGAGNDSIEGGDGNDTIQGGSGNNFISGGGGSDVLVGGAGADTILGGAGNDWILGGGGADSIEGGAGDDTIRGGDQASSLSGGEGNDVITGGGGADTIIGGNGDNWLVGGAGDDSIEGGDGADTINGTSGNNSISGGGGADILIGGTGADTIQGGDGNDWIGGDDGANSLFGGAGNDTLSGGSGDDVLSGGAGADTFLFKAGTGEDVISDFTPGEDRILLTGLGIASFAELQPLLAQEGASTAIDLGDGDVILVTGVAVADLAATDFLFA